MYNITEDELKELKNILNNEMSSPRPMFVVENNNNWISVKDRLPEDDEQVLVIDDIGYYYVVTFEKTYGNFIEGCECMPIDAIYWQPLPEPPKAVQSCK